MRKRCLVVGIVSLIASALLIACSSGSNAPSDPVQACATQFEPIFGQAAVEMQAVVSLSSSERLALAPHALAVYHEQRLRAEATSSRAAGIDCSPAAETYRATAARGFSEFATALAKLDDGSSANDAMVIVAGMSDMENAINDIKAANVMAGRSR